MNLHVMVTILQPVFYEDKSWAGTGTIVKKSICGKDPVGKLTIQGAQTHSLCYPQGLWLSLS